MSIKDYCLAHSIPKESIYTRISYLKKVYPNLSPDELVSLAITSHTPKVEPKYHRGGMSLYTYCDKNNIKKYTIYNHIKILKRENPDLTDDELVEQAFTRNFREDQIIYYCGDTSLYKFCREHEIRYQSLRNWLSQELAKNPHQSVEELINFKLNGGNNKNRWYYLGIPLKDFCLHNDISYGSIRYYLLQLTKKPKHATWSDDKLVAYLVEKRFKINNHSLEEYCHSINFPYDVMHNLLKQELAKHPDLKFREILDTIIATINYYRLTNYGYLKQQPSIIKSYLEESTNNLRNQEVSKFLKLQR